MNPFSFSLNWLLLPLILAWSAAAYWAGDHNRNNAWLAKQAAAEQQAHLAFVAEVARGQAAAGKSVGEQQKLQKSYSLLEGKFNALILRGPIVVFRDRLAGSVVPGRRVDACAVGESGTKAPISTGSGAADSGEPGIGLSLGAVWVWNSALTGIDTPAGACGAADTTSQACAADSGLGLEDAWENHAANAKSCAQDRLRHQQLINYLQPSSNGPTHDFRN